MGLGVGLQAPGSSERQRREAREGGRPWGRQSRRVDLDYFVGASLLEAGNFSGALQEFGKVVAADAHFAAGWSRLGEATAALGQLREADGYFRRAIAIYPAARQPRSAYRDFLRAHPKWRQK